MSIKWKKKEKKENKTMQKNRMFFPILHCIAFLFSFLPQNVT